MNGSVLEERHKWMLVEDSGICEAVVAERGYRSIVRKQELKDLGFSNHQCKVPGLLLPVRGLSGEIVLYQYRPDEPRVKDGKPVKYETPARSDMVLDVHPRSLEHLDDPSIPLFITEGIKKGDALVSREACVVALLGVCNWRGTNDKGGKVALPEWDRIALNDRKAIIVFDSDVMIKPGVHAALVRLKAFLEGR